MMLMIISNKESYHNAKTFLRKNNVEEEIIEKICNVISTISYKGTDTKTPETIEGKIVKYISSFLFCIWK